MPDEPETREVFSYEFTVALCEKLTSATIAFVVEELHLPPFMHALCMAIVAEHAEHTLKRVATEDGFASFLDTRDKFLTNLREAVKAAAEKAKASSG